MERVRIDKWLWAARYFKTRALASKACELGRVESNGQTAKASKEALDKSGNYRKPIATQIVPAETFYEAEDYHQQYLEKRGMATCHIKS